jgi:hypothetical protein
MSQANIHERSEGLAYFLDKLPDRGCIARIDF